MQRKPSNLFASHVVVGSPSLDTTLECDGAHAPRRAPLVPPVPFMPSQVKLLHVQGCFFRCARRAHSVFACRMRAHFCSTENACTCVRAARVPCAAVAPLGSHACNYTTISRKPCSISTVPRPCVRSPGATGRLSATYVSQASLRQMHAISCDAAHCARSRVRAHAIVSACGHACAA